MFFLCWMIPLLLVVVLLAAVGTFILPHQNDSKATLAPISLDEDAETDDLLCVSLSPESSGLLPPLLKTSSLEKKTHLRMIMKMEFET